MSSRNRERWSGLERVTYARFVNLVRFRCREHNRHLFLLTSAPEHRTLNRIECVRDASVTNLRSKTIIRVKTPRARLLSNFSAPQLVNSVQILLCLRTRRTNLEHDPSTLWTCSFDSRLLGKFLSGQFKRSDDSLGNTLRWCLVISARFPFKAKIEPARRETSSLTSFLESSPNGQ